MQSLARKIITEEIYIVTKSYRVNEHKEYKRKKRRSLQNKNKKKTFIEVNSVCERDGEHNGREFMFCLFVVTHKHGQNHAEEMGGFLRFTERFCDFFLALPIRKYVIIYRR